MTIPHDKVRVSFAIPWEGKLLLGTTDTLHEGEPETARVTDDDVRTILAEAAVAVDGLGEVRATFCGLRVLPGGAGRDGERAPRDGLHSTGPLGMLSVAGGKLTTYRRIALDALEQLGVRNLDRGRGRFRAPTGSTASPGRSSSTRRRARTCSTSTARSRARCSRPPPTIRRCSSRSSPAAPTCARRSSTRASTSGRAPTRTSSGGGRRPGSRANRCLTPVLAEARPRPSNRCQTPLRI